MFFLIPVFIVIGLIQFAVSQTPQFSPEQNVLIPIAIIFALYPICIAVITYGLHAYMDKAPQTTNVNLNISSWLPYLFFFLAILPIPSFTETGSYANISLIACVGSTNELEARLVDFSNFLKEYSWLAKILVRLLCLSVFYLLFAFYMKTYEFFNKKGYQDYQTSTLLELFDANKILTIGYLFLVVIEIASVGANWQEEILNNFLLSYSVSSPLLVYFIYALESISTLALPFLLFLILPLTLPFIVGWQPLPPGPILDMLGKVAKQNHFRYHKIYLAPNPGLVTAGVIGIFPKATNIVFTRDILELLDTKELEAVMLHEIGHVKHYHLFVYFAFIASLQILVLFLGIFIPSITDSTTAFVLSFAWILFGIRFGWGWLSRQCERQADLHAAEVQKNPQYLVGSFIKISALGIPLDKPSWHHGSLRTRINNLEEAFNENGKNLRENIHRRIRKIKVSIIMIFLLFFLTEILFKSYTLNKDELSKYALKSQMAMNLFKQQRYKESSTLLSEIIQSISNSIDKEESSVQSTLKILQLTSLYNNACALALENKTDEAIDNLLRTIPLYTKAVMQDGLSSEGLNVQKVKTDTDLDNLRSNERFKQFLHTLAEKETELGVKSGSR